MNEIKSKDFFKNELEIILHIHFDAKYYFKDNEYLDNPDTVAEKAALRIFFVRRLKIAFWRLGIIEISKLFQKSRNQHYNLIDYLKDLHDNYDNYPWMKNFPKAKLNEWLERLNSERILTTLRKIDIQRNQYFAHTDKNPIAELKDSIIEFQEINELIDFTEEIIFELKEKCLDVHLDMEIVGMEKAGHILEMVSWYYEKKKQNALDADKDLFNELKTNRP
jgi:hypothetical protein